MRLALFLFVTAAASFAPPPAGAAQVAASIEFDAAPRPAVLPEDMQPLPGASLKFLAIKAIDGSKIDAALKDARAAFLVAGHTKRSPRTKGHDARGRSTQLKLITERTWAVIGADAPIGRHRQ